MSTARTRWTPETLARAAYLRGAGRTDEAIANAVGACSPRAVRDALRRYGVGCTAPPQIHVPEFLLAELGPAASARGMGVHRLAERIIGTICAEPGLVDAVLDDAGGQV